MAARKTSRAPRKRPVLADVIHQHTVVLEEIRGQFSVFGESLRGFREHVDAKFTEVDRRFDEVDHEIGRLKDAVLQHGRELKQVRSELTQVKADLTDLRTEVRQQRKVDRDEVESIVEAAVRRVSGSP